MTPSKPPITFELLLPSLTATRRTCLETRITQNSISNQTYLLRKTKSRLWSHFFFPLLDGRLWSPPVLPIPSECPCLCRLIWCASVNRNSTSSSTKREPRRFDSLPCAPPERQTCPSTSGSFVSVLCVAESGGLVCLHRCSRLSACAAQHPASLLLRGGERKAGPQLSGIAFTIDCS